MAILTHASVVSGKASKSLLSRRERLSQPNVRSTTQLSCTCPDKFARLEQYSLWCPYRRWRSRMVGLCLAVRHGAGAICPDAWCLTARRVLRAHAADTWTRPRPRGHGVRRGGTGRRAAGTIVAGDLAEVWWWCRAEPRRIGTRRLPSHQAPAHLVMVHARLPAGAASRGCRVSSQRSGRAEEGGETNRALAVPPGHPALR